MKFKFIKKENVSKIPSDPGVYCFKSEKSFLYIGKASNLKKRIKNHLRKNAFRDNLFVDKIKKVGWIIADSEIEALILEANLIKKHKPKYNVVWRDDKNYFYVKVTKEDLPKVFIIHQIKEPKKSQHIGPFTEGRALKRTLKMLRKVFPYYTTKKHSKKLCPWCYLELCPGPEPDKKEYKKNIKRLVDVLKGKNRKVLKNLKKEMEQASSRQDFEKAAKARDQITALENILAHVRVLRYEIEPKKIDWPKTKKGLKKLFKVKKIERIEAYDVSNIQGKQATGSMVTFIRGKPNKNLYRKFRIKISGKPNDIAMIKEVLSRRLKHKEWDLPDIILIDGGKSQLKAAQLVISQKRLKMPVIALAKRKNELFFKEFKKPILLKNLSRDISSLILQLRNEAHRFAIQYHRKLRLVDLKPSS
jgi:excinuclease ABC subunit C